MEKIDTKMQYILILSGIFIFLFILSLLFFLILKGDRTRIVLFFPDTISGKLVGEERYIKSEKNKEDKVYELISEILLGPSLPGSSPLFPANTEIISVFIKKTHIFINFSRKIIFQDIKTPLDFHKGIQACINSLKFNFPWIKNISFFVNGESITLEPGSDLKQNENVPQIKFITDILK
ncbi:MAG: GerMN domain-containing protein [Spirochaetales bacterium]|nr:GerMN domain-containing protein [Spirochaetales bacterium]